ncbi:MAG: RNA polymerase sporulation sigma factor SigK [Clostridia bacterium]|nr:RNA polymerase sporulation sigma factor SigK [Clostridia bacterium]
MLEAILSVLAVIAVNVWFFAGYIGSKGNFPKPLSKDEEEKYLKRMYAGDEQAKNILIERNLRLVAHLARKYSGSGQDNEDLISIGTIGLIKGISSFKAEKGAKLATYAARCIENEILMSMRSSKKFQNEVSINDKIGMDSDGNEITLIDILEDTEPDVSEKVSLKMETARMYDKIKETLSEREAKIIALRFGLGGCKQQTQHEIAESFGISRSYVSRIEKKALLKLKSALQKKDLH